MDNQIYKLHAVITGRVQEVGFRYFTQRTATKLGIVGWVKNRPDRKVELEAYGNKKVLEQFIGNLKRGPSAAHVTDVLVNWNEVSTIEYHGFSINY